MNQSRICEASSHRGHNYQIVLESIPNFSGPSKFDRLAAKIWSLGFVSAWMNTCCHWRRKQGCQGDKPPCDVTVPSRIPSIQGLSNRKCQTSPLQTRFSVIKANFQRVYEPNKTVIDSMHQSTDNMLKQLKWKWSSGNLFEKKKRTLYVFIV